MRWKSVLIILIVSFLFTFPFYRKGYFETHDGGWAVVRLAEMSREIHDFQFPPRWADYLNHGFGYPLFLFTYPLPYYFGIFFKALGFSFVDSIKVIFVLSTFLGAFGMYAFSKRYWGNFGGLISSIFYVIVPYRLVDLYIRGSIGESVAMAVFPLLFWATDKLIYKEHKNGFLVTLFFSFLILSHNTSALFFTLLLFCYLIVKVKKNSKEILRISIPFLQGLLLASFFWLPAIMEKKYIYLSVVPLADKNMHFASLFELLVHNQGLGVKPPLFIGYTYLISFVLTVLVIFIHKKNTVLKRYLVFNLSAIIVSFLLLFSFSSVFWNLPLFNSVDFPWRILIVTIFLLSLISGSVVLLPKGKWLGIILLTLGIFLYFPYASVQNSINRNDSYYETNDASTTSNDELMPIWVSNKPKNRPEEKINSGEAEIANLQFNSKKIEFTTRSSSDTQILVNTLYFPGWKFWVDGKEIKIYPSSETGLINFSITQGVHKVIGRFTRTPIRLLADLLSVVGLLVIMFANRRYLLKK